jgi:subtilisin
MDFYTPPYIVEEAFISCSQENGWGISYLAIPEVWELSRGTDITVAVLDSGRVDHIDINDNILSQKIFTKDDFTSGHANHVSGIIAAEDNNTGIIGVSPDSRLYVGKVIGGVGGSLSTVCEGLSWAIENNVDVISMSFGSFQYFKELHDLIKEAYSKGIICVAACGNEGNLGVNYPAMFPECISVGAIDNTGKICDFSSKGYKVDVVAPGKDILSTYVNNSYAIISGTSQATPLVSGIIACYLSYLKAKGIKYTTYEIFRKIKEKAFYRIRFSSKYQFSHDYGFGIISPKGLFT